MTKFLTFKGPTHYKVELDGWFDCNISTDKNIYLCSVGVFGRSLNALKYAKTEIEIKIKKEDESPVAE